MKTSHTLYGDGIHDDFPAIQEMLDAGTCEVCLPAPKKHYLIGSTLTIPGNCRLKLPRFAEIRLADGANCLMLKNKTAFKPENRFGEDIPESFHKLFYYSEKWSYDAEDTCRNIEIEGGVWNFNNMNQLPNPQQTFDFGPDGRFIGNGMLFFNVRNLRLSNMTLKDPTNYAVAMEGVHNFTVENIMFDFNTGNPYAVNMDGIHLNGNCSHGLIRNLHGACYDDLIALNAHEGAGGDITDIEIRGIHAENCHSAVRLLTVRHRVGNIHISDVFGSYYQYCIGFTKYYPGETTGCFDAVTLENICASKSERLPVQEMHMTDKSYVFPFIWLQEDTHTKALTVNGLHRREEKVPADTIHIGAGASADRIMLRDITLENHTGKPCETLINHGTVGTLFTDLDPELITNCGVIEKIIRT